VESIIGVISTLNDFMDNWKVVDSTIDPYHEITSNISSLSIPTKIPPTSECYVQLLETQTALDLKACLYAINYTRADRINLIRSSTDNIPYPSYGIQTDTGRILFCVHESIYEQLKYQDLKCRKKFFRLRELIESNQDLFNQDPTLRESLVELIRTCVCLLRYPFNIVEEIFDSVALIFGEIPLKLSSQRSIRILKWIKKIVESLHATIQNFSLQDWSDIYHTPDLTDPDDYLNYLNMDSTEELNEIIQVFYNSPH